MELFAISGFLLNMTDTYIQFGQISQTHKQNHENSCSVFYYVKSVCAYSAAALELPKLRQDSKYFNKRGKQKSISALVMMHHFFLNCVYTAKAHFIYECIKQTSYFVTNANSDVWMDWIWAQWYDTLRISPSQHDELESNLKKILHSNGIWGLEANSM